MKLLTNYIVALANLLEAEIAHLRKEYFRTATAIVIMFGAVAMLVAGLLLVMLAIFLPIASSAGYPLAALVTGVIAFLFMGLITVVAIWLAR